jgi:class 3 adenylate cyclase/pimeloyl-ACP methyl ester carboxylesterase
MINPPTRYSRSSEGYVAYQTLGEGPRDILFVANWGSNLDAMWEEPSLAYYFHRLARIGRVICFDKRGSGVSDPVALASLPTLEEWMDDARVVLDAVGSEQAAIIGDTEGGPMATLFAATSPSRVSALVLVNSFARWRRAPDYPIGMPDITVERLISLYERHWGQNADMLGLTAPTIAGDPRMREWFVRYQRLSMPPGAATRMYRWVTQLDVRSILPAISVPTLVLHRAENRHYRVAHGQYLAEHIPGSRFTELPGADCYPFHTTECDTVLDEIHEFLTGVREAPPSDRELSTVLFTDIVGSTDLAAKIGDARWLETREAHNDLVRKSLLAFHGREIATTGDGFLATFDGPARGVHCAVRIRDAVRALGLDIRAGLHTGEIERRDNDVGGLGVHVAARVMGEAKPGEVLVSGTVADLVIGSGIGFLEKPSVQLKGVPGTWRMLEVTKIP